MRSYVVTDAMAHEIRLAALDEALAEADRRFGPVAEEEIRGAEARLAQPGTRRARSKRRRAT